MARQTSGRGTGKRISKVPLPHCISLQHHENFAPPTTTQCFQFSLPALSPCILIAKPGPWLINSKGVDFTLPNMEIAIPVIVIHSAGSDSSVLYRHYLFNPHQTLVNLIWVTQYDFSLISEDCGEGRKLTRKPISFIFNSCTILQYLIFSQLNRS